MNLTLFDSFYLNVLTTLVILITSLYLFSIKTFDFWKKLGVKYVDPTPFFGNTFKSTFRKVSPAINQQQIYNTYSNERYFGMFMFRTPLLMVRDPHLINCILSKDFAHFYDRGLTYDERLDPLSLHLVNLRGQKWKSLRSKLTPAFSSGKLKMMCYQLEECAQSLSDYFDCAVTSDAYDVREIMAKFSTDVIGSCAFGLQFNSLKDPNSEFRKMGQEIFRPSLKVLLKFIMRTVHPNLPYFLNLKFLRPEVEKFFLDFVKNAIDQREEKQIERKDFIQLLIELRKADLLANNNASGDSKDKSFVLSDQVLASNAFVFFLAGFETTASTMSFFLLELAVNPKIQDAVRNEIEDALNKHGELNYDTIKDLPYMEMVISETLRKYPIAIGLLRECTKTYQVPGSTLNIEEGTKVLIPVYSIQHDPQHFPNPEQFDPERFSSENKAKIKPGTYLPFGDGPRICIGLRFALMEMKYAFCKIIPKYKFTLNERMVYPVQFKRGGSPLLAPEDGIWLNVRRRKLES